MAIKAIYFGQNTAENRFSIVSRGGARIVLALTIEIDTISEQLRLDAETAVNFSITEIPLAVAQKVVADTAEGQVAVVVLEYGRPVADDIKALVAAFVGKSVRSIDINSCAN